MEHIHDGHPEGFSCVSCTDNKPFDPVDKVLSNSNLEKNLKSQDVQEKCWGCDALLHVPLINGRPSEIFRCSWCWAITDQGVPGLYSRRQATLFAKVFVTLNRLRWVMVAVVNGIIMSIIVPGAVVILPEVFRAPLVYYLNVGLTLLLSMEVCLNYVGCIYSHPGNVAIIYPPPAKGANGRVPAASYNGFRFCQLCRAPKSCDAHHCSTCGICVVQADHHCPFINNCVGRGNIRSFLLFLLWVSISVAYSFSVCVVLVARDRAAILSYVTDALAAFRRGSSFLDILVALMSSLRLSHVAAMYILSASLNVALGCTGLLFVTLRHRVEDQNGGIFCTWSPFRTAGMWLRILSEILGSCTMCALLVPAVAQGPLTPLPPPESPAPAGPSLGSSTEKPKDS